MTLAQVLEDLRPTLFGPAPFGTPKCKDRIQMNGDKAVKCFGERYHTVYSRGIHAGFYKNNHDVKIIRWETKYVT
jgi:hypothetical protein